MAGKSFTSLSRETSGCQVDVQIRRKGADELKRLNVTKVIILHESLVFLSDTHRNILEADKCLFAAGDKCQDSKLIRDIHYVAITLIVLLQWRVTNGFTLIKYRLF